MDKKIKIIALVGLFFVILASLLFFNFKREKPDIFKELSRLNADEMTIEAIRNQDCKNLVKTKEYWLVNDCKDGIYFKLFLKSDGYYLGYCTNWTTPREAFLKLSSLIGRKCLNESAEDYGLNLRSSEIKGYSVCGLKIFFRDECIVMVI